MPEGQIERPAAVVVFSIYEALAAAVGIFGQLMMVLARSLSPRMAALHIPLRTTVISWVGILLAIAGAITLWLLRRESFVLLTTRFLLTLTVFIVSIAAPQLLMPKRVALGTDAVTTATPPNPGPAVPRVNRRPPRPLSPSSIRVFGQAVTALFLLISACISIYTYWLFFMPHAPKPLEQTTYPPASSWPAPPQ